MVSFFKVAALTACFVAAAQAKITDLKLCKLPNYNLQKAQVTYPNLKNAIQKVLDQGVATWYTDRVTEAEHKDFLQRIKTTCKSDETMLISVYGLPQKDCADGWSAEGGNRNSSMYKKWVQELADAVGKQKVIYIYEADALALTIDGKCGLDNDYIPNIKAGMPLLTANPNARLYLDIGYWTLQWPKLITQIIENFKQVETAAKITGIAVGTSNYRPISEMEGLCNNFTRELGTNKYPCVFDTSRDFVQDVPGVEWCNQLWAGMGHPSTAETSYNNVDAYLWIKPVGESDGECNDGPKAGTFWYKGFVTFWNQGWFVKREGEKPLPLEPPATTAPEKTKKPKKTTPAPTTPAPTKKTKKPKKTTPAPTTPAPTKKTKKPKKTTPPPTTAPPDSESSSESDSASA